MKIVLWQGEQIAPSKIVCVGRNYVEHIQELNNEVPEEMVLFCKPNSAICNDLIAHRGEAIHYELELCLLFDGERFCAVGVGFDLTKRAQQSRLKQQGLPWERAKAFDGSAVFSEFVSVDAIDDSLMFALEVDGQARQRGNIELMISAPEKILTEIQSFMTLQAGDIVMTGTPKGVGALVAGSRYQACLHQHHTLLCELDLTAQ